MTIPHQTHRQNLALLLALLAVAAGMTALAYASVPLYRLFCQLTGFGGTPQLALGQNIPHETAVGGPVLRVQFNTDISSTLPWEFVPLQREVSLHAGEDQLIAFRATNHGSTPLTGTAVFNVTPPQAGAYFVKTQCFCFERQTLAPGQSVDFPVQFFIDPAIRDDPEAADIREITLSYTFYPAGSSRP